MEVATPNTESSQYLRRGAMCEATSRPFCRAQGFWNPPFTSLLLMGLIYITIFTASKINLHVLQIVSTEDGLFTKQRAYKNGAILTTACAIVCCVLVLLEDYALCDLFYCYNPDHGILDILVSICWCSSRLISTTLCMGVSSGLWIDYYRLRKIISLRQPISPTNTEGDRPEHWDGGPSSQERTQGDETPPPRYYEDKTSTVDSAPDRNSQSQETTGPDGISTVKSALIRNHSR